MVSARAKFASAHARQVVESCPPEKSTRACSRMGRSWNCGLRWGARQFPGVCAGLQDLHLTLQSARVSSPGETMPDTTSQPVSAAVRSDAEWRVDRALPRALARILALDDFEEPARRYLPRPMFGYVSGGAETNASLSANRAQFDEIELSPRVLVDVSARTAKTALFGRVYDAPFGIAPMGGTSMAAFRGDVVLARAAAEAGIPMIMSGASLTRLEDVRAAGSTAWFQAYLPGETGPITRLLERVARAGFDTPVLTADVPVSANRENNVRSRFAPPPPPRGPESARARRAVRIRRPALPLRGRDRRGSRRAPWDRAPLRRDRARHGAPGNYHACADDAGAGQAAASFIHMNAEGSRR